MNLDVSQKNLHLFIPSKICRIAEMMVEDKKVSISKAVSDIYQSKTYGKLENEDSKLWHWSPVGLYHEILSE